MDFRPRGVDHRRARPRRRSRLLSARRERASRTASCAVTRAPLSRRARCSARPSAITARLFRALRLRRACSAIEFFVAARPAGRQRDGAARAQLRALDHRGRGDQPVREPRARDPRPAARRHGAARARAMINFIGRMPQRGRAARAAGPALHDYGKSPRPGRKLGHVTFVTGEPRAPGSRRAATATPVESLDVTGTCAVLACRTPCTWNISN